MKRFINIVTFLLLSCTCLASKDSILIDALVRNIEALQVKQFDGEFYPGMFNGFRECGGFPHNYQRDNNIFFTAISAFSLKNMLPHLNQSNSSTVKSIIRKATTAYPYFQNRQGNPFYNFWPTDAPIMPHTLYFKYLKSVFAQGEDADDSVMILMSAENNDGNNHLLKKRMVEVSNLSKRKIISTFKKYRQYPAFSTWLGYKMTPDFDFSVQCNLLYFTLDKKLPFTTQDSATLDLLTAMVKNREYVKHPIYISPYYVKTSVLLYHLTRLMSRFPLSQLDVYRPQLIEDIRRELDASTNVMEQIILSTALLRLNAQAKALDVADLQQFEESNQKKYVFFQARPAFSYPTPFKQIFLRWSYINYYFYCPAYNKVLLLEYLIERNKKHS